MTPLDLSTACLADIRSSIHKQPQCCELVTAFSTDTSAKKRLKLLRHFFTLNGPCWLESGFFVSDVGNLLMGKFVYANHNLTLINSQLITLEDEVFIGPNSLITTISPCNNVQAPVVVKRRAWLGANVRIMPGVTVGESAVVGAGTVVTEDVPPRRVVAGNPCRVIRQIKE